MQSPFKQPKVWKLFGTVAIVGGAILYTAASSQETPILQQATTLNPAPGETRTLVSSQNQVVPVRDQITANDTSLAQPSAATSATLAETSLERDLEPVIVFKTNEADRVSIEDTGVTFTNEVNEVASVPLADTNVILTEAVKTATASENEIAVANESELVVEKTGLESTAEQPVTPPVIVLDNGPTDIQPDNQARVRPRRPDRNNDDGQNQPNTQRDRPQRPNGQNGRPGRGFR